jgi:hypothetical protein
VTLLFAVLTFLMALPFSAAPGARVVADAPDTHLYIWTLAWDTYAFLRQPLLIFDANIYYPYANTLAYSENLIGSALFAAPIIWLTGDLVLAMNLVALLTGVLCGTGGYLLARRLHLGHGAAVLCGIVFAFAPPRFYRTGQLHMTAVQWIPFALAFLHGYLESRRRRDLLWAIACFTLQVLSSGHGAAFLAIAIVLMLVWHVARGGAVALGAWVNDFGVAGAYLLAPSIWVMLPYRLAQQEAGLTREYPAEAMPGWASFVASPSRLHMRLQEALLGRVVNDEAIAYLFPGVLVLLLAALALIRWRPLHGASLRDRLQHDATWLYGGMAAVGTLMFVQWPLDLWRWVYGLPGFNFIRVPSRFIILVVLCLGVLAAIAFDGLTRRASRSLRTAAAVALSVLLLAEYSGYPYPNVPYRLEIPEIDRWLDTQPKPFVVAEVPVPSEGDLGALERQQTMAMLHATAHWQKTVHGYSGIRRPLHQRLYRDLNRFPDDASLTSLRAVGVTHVVVHTDHYPPGAWPAVERRLAATPDLRLEHTVGAGRVYTIVPR